MKTKYWTSALALITLSAGLTVSGCGGQPAEPLDANAAGLVLGNMAAAMNMIPTGNNVPAMPVAGVTTNSTVKVSSTGCETITPSSLVDNDHDNIAAYKKYTFDCSSSISAGYSYTQKGTIEIRDKDETKEGMFGGIRVDFDIPVMDSEDLATGQKYHYSHSGYWDYQNVGGSLVSKSSYTGASKYAPVNGLENDYSYTADWNYKMTPDDISLPWDSGKVEMDGQFVLSGKFVYEDQTTSTHTQREGGWTIKYYTKDLTFDHSCTKFYKTGSYVMDDGTNKMELVYNCSSVKFYVNGQESDWWD